MSGETLHGHYFEELSVGQVGVFAKTVTEADIVAFAGVSGDFNPVHINEEFAKDTLFKGRIAHGMLSAAFISTVFGTRLPGPGCIYVSQMLKFKAPVRIGDTVTAKVELTALVPEKKFATFRTTCEVAGKIVLDGEATLMVPSKG
ncbi:MAG: MaoC family dehydratase [Actinomycetota bacterium]